MGNHKGTAESIGRELQKWVMGNLAAAKWGEFHVNDFSNMITWDDYRIYAGGARIADYEAYEIDPPSLDEVKLSYITLIKMFCESAGIEAAKFTDISKEIVSTLD